MNANYAVNYTYIHWDNLLRCSIKYSKGGTTLDRSEPKQFK